MEKFGEGLRRQVMTHRPIRYVVALKQADPDIQPGKNETLTIAIPQKVRPVFGNPCNMNNERCGSSHFPNFMSNIFP